MRPVHFLFVTRVACLLSFLLLLAAGFAQPVSARARHHRRHRHVRLPRMLPTVIPVAREGFDVVLRGRASWYGAYFQGRRTTSGERYDRFQYTCAHKTLPFGTRLRVTNLRNGKTVVVRVTDRGPFRHQRILDLSERAARPLGLCDAGAATVVAVVVPAETPLGLTDAPDNLTALTEADPKPSAPFTAYLLAALPAATGQAAPAASETAAAPEAAELAVAPAATDAKQPCLVLAGTFAEDWQAEALQARIRAFDPQLTTSLEPTTLAGRRAKRVVIGRLDGWLTAEAVRRKLQLWGIAGKVQRQEAAARPVLAGVATTSECQ